MAAGEYRAPRSPRQLTEFYWFCLEHVRAYNQAWNYYKGMTPEEVERETRSDVGWGRPTWPLGRQGPSERPNGHRMHDPFDLFEEEARAEAKARARAREEAESQERDSEEGRAYRALDLFPPVTLTEVKARYKELAKRLHPDVNGGDAAAEERLKRINQAYAVLRKVLSRPV